jgi:hypothetical protein
MRFTSVAAVPVATACAALALPAQENVVANVTPEARRIFEVRVFQNKYWGGVYKAFTTEGSHNIGFTAQSWQYYDDGCCVRYVALLLRCRL